MRVRVCLRGDRVDLGGLSPLRRRPGLVAAAIASARTKASLGALGVRVLGASPHARRAGFVVARPIARRRIRNAVHDVAEAAESLTATLNQIVEAGQELGLIEKPRRRPAAPYVLAGVAIGAGAVYFLGGGRRNPGSG